MPDYPGDLTDEEKHHSFLQMRAEAVEKWGERRAADLEDILRKTAIAVGRVERLQFSPDEAPGFYLHLTTPENTPRKPAS